MKNSKTDMSKVCDFKYHEYWMAANHYRTMSQIDWFKWFNKNCGQCIYMCETCMYGEGNNE